MLSLRLLERRWRRRAAWILFPVAALSFGWIYAIGHSAHVAAFRQGLADDFQAIANITQVFPGDDLYVNIEPESMPRYGAGGDRIFQVWAAEDGEVLDSSASLDAMPAVLVRPAPALVNGPENYSATLRLADGRFWCLYGRRVSANWGLDAETLARHGLSIEEHQVDLVVGRPAMELLASLLPLAAACLVSALALPCLAWAGLRLTMRSLARLVQRLVLARERERGFLAHAAHELRTPLAELRALVDLAELEQAEGLPVAPMLQDMRGVAQRMGELLDALFQLARVERSAEGAADGARSLAPVVLEQMLDAAWQAQAARAGQRGLGLAWQAPPNGGPRVVWSQPTLLRALVDNLLGNALAHARADSLVSVSLGSGAAPTLVLRNRCEPVAVAGTAPPPGLHLGQGLVIARLYAQALGIHLQTRRDGDCFEASLAWPEPLPASASDHLGPAPWAGLRRLADWLRNRPRRALGSPLSNLNSEEMP